LLNFSHSAPQCQIVAELLSFCLPVLPIIAEGPRNQLVALFQPPTRVTFHCRLNYLESVGYRKWSFRHVNGTALDLTQDEAVVAALSGDVIVAKNISYFGVSVPGNARWAGDYSCETAQPLARKRHASLTVLCKLHYIVNSLLFSWPSGKGVGPECERSGVRFPNCS
jgi:hypothetical protein